METNTCKVNNPLNADALLPPRKRLLAGLKRQNSNINSPSPSTEDTPFDSNPLIAQLNNSNLSIEDIVEASRIAATEAAKIATSARAKSEEKAEKAAKAFSAARNALDIVATLKEAAAKKGKCMKMDKMKKRTPLEELYKKGGSGTNTNSRKDEELARNLHRTINSSPRISKGGRMKQKKLLSVYSFRDQTGFKEEGSSVGRNGGLLSSGDNMVTQTTMRKCQSLKVISCVQQSEVMQL